MLQDSRKSTRSVLNYAGHSHSTSSMIHKVHPIELFHCTFHRRCNSFAIFNLSVCPLPVSVWNGLTHGGQIWLNNHLAIRENLRHRMADKSLIVLYVIWEVCVRSHEFSFSPLVHLRLLCLCCTVYSSANRASMT